MVITWRTLALIALVVAFAPRLDAQSIPTPDDTRHSMLRATMLGLLSGQPDVPEAQARRDCVTLPVDAPNDRLQGPHGDTQISTRCEVLAYEALAALRPAQWTVARYRWTSIFTAEDTSRGPAAQDTVLEEDVVVLNGTRP